MVSSFNKLRVSALLFSIVAFAHVSSAFSATKLKPIIDEKETEELADLALSTLNNISVENSKRKLCRILEANKQLESSGGVLYYLQLEVLSLETLNTDVSMLCDDFGVDVNRSRLLEICSVTLLRTWATSDYSPVNVQVVQSQCSAADPQRYKRHSPLVGGWNEIDVSSNEAKEVADRTFASLTGLFTGCSTTCEILSAHKQLVSGTNTRVKTRICKQCSDSKIAPGCLICTTNYYEQAWTNTRKLSSPKCEPETNNRVEGDDQKDLHREAFNDFTAKYGKKYESADELERRYRIFRANVKKIELLQQTEQGDALYGITEFADLTKTEFRRKYLGLVVPESEKARLKNQSTTAPSKTINLPNEFDWRSYNVVTPVKNQGMCGSCWAFSVTGNVEGQWAIKNNKLLSFSEQELVDCDKLDDGCSGGYMTNGYKAIESLGGLEVESDYPYEGYNEKCHFSASKVKATISGSLNISSDETVMAEWLFKNGPISIGLNANAMQFYFGGVSHPWKMFCDPEELDHGVLLVGYGIHRTKFTHKTLPYWLIKNSWGPHWGEKGYYRLYRGSGACGVNKMASSAII